MSIHVSIAHLRGMSPSISPVVTSKYIYHNPYNILLLTCIDLVSISSSASSIIELSLVPLNTEPPVIELALPRVNYSEHGPPVAIFPDIVLTDADDHCGLENVLNISTATIATNSSDSVYDMVII